MINLSFLWPHFRCRQTLHCGLSCCDYGSLKGMNGHNSLFLHNSSNTHTHTPLFLFLIPKPEDELCPFATTVTMGLCLYSQESSLIILMFSLPFSKEKWPTPKLWNNDIHTTGPWVPRSFPFPTQCPQGQLGCLPLPTPTSAALAQAHHLPLDRGGLPTYSLAAYNPSFTPQLESPFKNINQIPSLPGNITI